MRTFKDEKEALKFVMNINELPWGNAAGTCKDGKLAQHFAAASMQIVSFGSMTAAQRTGNAGDNFYYDEQTGDSINAWGIPNKGIAAYLSSELPETRQAVNTAGSQLWASISAGDKFVAQEYHDMARSLDTAEAADVIEANMSCGNMKVDNEYKPIVCYDLGAFDEGVAALCTGAGKKKKAVKLTPTTERQFLFGNVDSCLKHGVDYLILANTVPNSYLEKPDGTPAITMVRGGLGGRGLRPIVTGMIQMVKPALKGTGVKIIAAGGIECGADAYHYLKHGADGFIFATLLWNRNFDPAVAQEIIFGDKSRGMPGLIDLLVTHGLPD